MQVRATRLSFIEGHRRRPGKVYELRDPKHFDKAVMQKAEEPWTDEPVAADEPVALSQLAGGKSFVEVYAPKDPKKEPKPEKKADGKSTGDQEVI